MSSLVVNSYPLEEEYKKPTGITPEDVAELRKWLQTQPHLPNEHITDLDLILAFHSCKRCMATTKEVINTHYTLKTQYTIVFKDAFYDDNIDLVLKRVLLKPLPTRTKEGDAILFTRLLDTDVKNFLFVDSLRAVMMLLELWQYEEGTWPGLIILFDLGGLKFSHIFKIEMDAVKQFLQFLELAMFVKIKGIHLLNAPYFTDYFIALVKKFVNSELIEAFHIHLKGSKALEKYIDVAALPKEAGGSYKTYKECNEEVLLKMRANKDFFIMANKKRANESLQPDSGNDIPQPAENFLNKKQHVAA